MNALNQCIVCGGRMLGDGYTVVWHCENAEDFSDREPDSIPVYCSAQQKPKEPDNLSLFCRMDEFFDSPAVKEFASHRSGDRVQILSSGLFGTIESIDQSGTAQIRLDDGSLAYHDLCILSIPERHRS